MQILKPFALGLQTRCIEHRRRIGLCITASVYFPFAPAGQGTAWTDMSMWNFLGREMPEGPLIDEGVTKLMPEFLVHGSAFAPGGQATHCAVRARVGMREKRLNVFGTRYWVGDRISEPRPFDRIPLDWRHAYGGSDFPANPLGMGRQPVDFGRGPVRLLPQIELAGDPTTSPDHPIEPAAMGLIDLTWPQRSRFQGTYDGTWLKEQSPGFADDVDWRFFNLAPADQRFDAALAGDEPFEFTHMHPDETSVGGQLPGLRARCFVRYGFAEAPELRETPMRLTTVWFFPHAKRGVMLFQGLANCQEDDAGDVALLMGALEALGEPKSDAHYAAALTRRLDPQLGALHALRESDLLPAGLKGADPDFEEVQKDYRGEGLMAEAQRRGAAFAIELARDDARARGLDPDRLGIVMPPPQKPPPLEDLAEHLLAARAESLNAQVTAALDAAEQLRSARATAERHGIDPDSLIHRGPPTYRAAEHLKQVQAALPAGAPGAEGAPRLDAAALGRKFAQLEALERSAYLAAAHTQPPARPASPARARRVREAVLQAHAQGKSFFGADLTGADLSGMDLSGADFTAAWLESANLQGALLKGCSFACAVLAHADLTAADASDADFTSANLGRAKLATARLVQANLTQANLGDTQLAQTDLRQATLDGAQLLGASFGLADWRGVKANGLLFHRASLKDMVLHQAHLTQPQFVECDLSDADFSAAMLDRATFVQCKGHRTRFVKADMPGAVFVQGCDFSGADFGGAQMAGSNLRGSVLAAAGFGQALLDRSDFSEADLSTAQLAGVSARGALFIKTSLRAANLFQANLMDAVVQRADLRGCDLREANLFGADLSRVRSDAGTALGAALVKRAKIHPRRPVEPVEGAPA